MHETNINFGRRWFWILAAVLGIALLTMAACGGDDDDNGNGNGDGTPQPTGDATPRDANGDLPGELQDLQNLLRQFSEASGKVVMSFRDIDPDGEVEEGTITWYLDPPNRYRFDDVDSTSLFVVIQDGTTYYNCDADMVNGNPVDGVCYSGEDDDSFAGFFDDFFGAESDDFFDDIEIESVSRSTDTIAGMDAACFHIVGVSSDVREETTMCVSSAGIPLRIESVSEDGWEFYMEAIETGNVSASDFQPPFEVMEFDFDFDFDDFDFDDLDFDFDFDE